jgi:hypothetical protein
MIVSKTPGPGNYELNKSSIMQRLPSWSQSKSSRDYQNNMSNVGPG